MPDTETDTSEMHNDTDHHRLVAEFGAEPLTEQDRERFPGSHAFLERGLAFAGRDLDRFLAAIEADEPVSVVTGVGPSGPMHVGHAPVFYLARHLQREAGAHVYVPVSDDEKYYSRDQTLAETRSYTRENLRDVLAVGFDPARTQIIVDTVDADVVYPVATAFAKHVTPATREAVYGEVSNLGEAFYPAMQCAHLLIPQLARECGPHATIVPVAADQDPHVRLCRDIAGKHRFPVEKPGTVIAGFLPGLDGAGKSSSSDDAPTIRLDHDPETVRELVMAHAHSGGRETVAAHREHGGDPDGDVAFRYLRLFFEPDDAELTRLERDYRAGDLLSGELKAHAADKIAEFLRNHQSRRPSDDALESAIAPYRLSEDERAQALHRVGLAPDVVR